MAYQTLYRRYRPRRFAELRGQPHVVLAVRNAVRDDRVGHAYLFSGPRGTGKTTTARILAKALNCHHPVDGEPCCECASCLAVEAGTSFDVHELDAASNNGVDDIRDLVDKAMLGTPGRRKVYILDEVHMLSRAAEAALLKTLEEPPPHVVFVLATTDPQKVSSTIRSRTQHFEFHLLPGAELEDLVRHVIDDAGLAVPEEAVDVVLQQGRGSARDTLSALDQVVAAGGVLPEVEPLDLLVEALIDGDTAQALTAVAHATQAGRDPRTLAEHLVAHLRDAFLCEIAPTLVHLPDRTAARVADQGRRLGKAAAVRAMEVLGETLVELRQAPDPRLLLDVALVRLTNADVDASPAAILTRVERIEQQLAGGTVAVARAPAARDAPAPTTRDTPATAAREATGVPASPAPDATAGGRATLGARSRRGAAPGPRASEPAARQAPHAEPAPPAASSPPRAAPPAATAPAATAPTGRGVAPTRDQLTLAWADAVLPRLKGMGKALFAAGRFADGPGGVVLVLPNTPHLERCKTYVGEAEAALAAHFGSPVTLRMVTEEALADPASSASGATPPEEESIDPAELEDAPAETIPLDRIARHFPGAELVDEG